MKIIKKGIALLLCITLLATTALAFDGREAKYDNYDEMTDIEKFTSVLDFYTKTHIDSPSKEDMLIGFVDYLLKTNPDMLGTYLDNMIREKDIHNGFFTSAEIDEMFNSNIKYGIGVQAENRGGLITIKKLFDGNAQNGGMMVGDQIIAVDGKDVRGKSIEGVGALIAGELGTEVSITILRNTELNPITFNLKRGRIHIDSITYEVLPGKVGVITISDFLDSMAPYTYYFALRDLYASGVRSLIIDVRGNSGGYLEQALQMSNLLTTKEGQLMCITHSAKEGERKYYTTDEGFDFKKVAVLQNKFSASSAEIFAGILKDLGIAKVFGETSYGKARGQNYYPVGEESVVSVTVTDISLPVSGYYHGKGITPDVTLKNRMTTRGGSLNFVFDYQKAGNPSNIIAAEERLRTLGYFTDNADNTFDEDTKKALTIFQNRAGLKETGGIDLATIKALDAATMATINEQIINDLQLKKAVEYVR